MKRAMTLIEMMIALVVLGFVTAALVAVFGGHVSLSRPIEAQSIMIHDARAAYDILARELRHCNAIELGDTDSLQFRAMVGGVSQRYKYVVRDNILRREAGGGGLQEVVQNAVWLRFRYLMTDGNDVATPVTNANDQQVKQIWTRLCVTLPDRRDSIVMSGFVTPRNLR